MPRPARGRLTPWIESLILSYSVPEEDDEEQQGGRSSGGQLRAHVIGVGQLSLSQAQPWSSEGPTGLLYLSDGQLQIPAVLTAAAWELLQEQEDRESFSSLLNTTVCIQDYRLLFHMAPEQTRCRFFLSVGELATTAAGPLKDNTPCCTTLSSVRVKICQTWRALLGREESQRSQCGFELSELLGEWRHDCLQELLQDIRVRLSPKPSTSTPLGLHTTGWDLDRVTYKGEEPFSVPMRCLLIPEELSGDEQQMDSTQSSPLLVEEVMEESLSNPWDIFPPLCISSSSTSPEATPPPPPPTTDAAAVSSESSFLPAYQNQPSGFVSTAAASSSSSPPDGASTGRQNLLAVEQDGNETEEKPRKAKRKRSDPSPEALSTLVEEELSTSPPSWLFDSQAGSSGTEEASGSSRISPKRTRNTPSVHSDSSPFSYSYQVSGQNLQDLSRFRVAASLLHWAVKYLLSPNQTDQTQDVV
ncbi:adrenocortical dysplasia protein homolog [Stegastes partitus]|uniref:ACD shelterin complex subunit and telomerase recruitment factor n=1 Tax=Stegastes partitus TaxID=144197 RepID=A0A3B5B8G5_9TELE|nr:PREDICTED: adrenocortical dysplasia protein homolog [Stegastes partitus]